MSEEEKTKAMFIATYRLDDYWDAGERYTVAVSSSKEKLIEQMKKEFIFVKEYRRFETFLVHLKDEYNDEGNKDDYILRIDEIRVVE